MYLKINQMKKVIIWFTKTKRRRVLSTLLALLIVLTSIRFVFFKPKEVFASSLHWSFSEGYGTSIGDTSGNSNSGTITNAVWRTDDLCRTNKCLYFDGTGDYVSRTDDADLDFTATDDMTIMGWFRHGPIATNPDYLVAKHETTVAGGYKIWMDGDGDIAFGIDDDGAWGPEDVVGDDQSKNYDDNRWHHFAAVKDGTTGIYLYVDGQLIDSDTSLLATGTLANAAAFYIGIDADGSSNGWDGFIDEVKVYREVRTQAQILSDNSATAPEDGAGTSFGGSKTNLSDGLVGYWKMDESAANTCTGGVNDACDYSGNKYDLAWTNNTANTIGKFSQGTIYDGINDYASCTDASCGGIGKLDFDTATTTSLSFGAWFKTSTSGFQSILAKKLGSAASNAGYMLNVSTGNLLTCRLADGTNQVLSQSTATINDGLWHHGFCTSDGTTLRVYLDGRLVDQNDISTITGSVDSTSDFGFGIDGSGANDYTGTIDEGRVYNRTVSSSEIENLYKLGPAPVGFWKLDENTGTTAQDTSGSDNATTLTNTPKWTIGKFSSGIAFAGSDQHLIRADDSDFDFDDDADMTFETWFRHGTASIQEVILSKYNEAGYKIIMEADGDITCALDYDATWTPTDSATSTAATYDDDNWHHIACVKSGASSLSLYIDGLLITQDASLTATNTLTNTDPIYFGIDADGISNDFTGSLDNIQIYNYARSGAQVIEDMNGGHPAPGSPIGSAIAQWKFEGSMGANANFPAHPGQDSSTTNTDLTLASAVTLTSSGKFGQAYQGASDARATRTDDADGRLDFIATNNFTLSTWFKRSTISADEYLLSKISSNGAYGYDLYMDSSGDIVFGITDQTGAAPNEETIGNLGRDYDDNVWHHAVAVKTGTSSIRLYVDGVEIASDTSLAETGSLANDGIFRVGDLNSTDGTDEFLGSIDEIQIFRSPLTLEQIKVLYNQGSSAVFGATSTDSSGAGDNSLARLYCIPGDTSSCDAPVGHFTFDENGGQRLDSVSQTSTGGYADQMSIGATAAAGETDDPLFVPGIMGSALEFDGSNDQADGTDDTDLEFSNTEDFTMMGWFYRDTATSDDVLMDKGKRTSANNDEGFIIWVDDSTDTVNLRVTDGTTNCSVAPCSFNLAGTTTFLTPGWHHFAVVFDQDDSTKTKIYIDGIDDNATTADTIGNVGALAGANEFNFGSTTNGGEPFDGKLDDMRIYRYARTHAQIMWDYNRGKPFGYYRLDECSGATAQDVSVDPAGSNRNNDGTITPGTLGTHTSVGTCNSGSVSEMWDDGQTGKRNYSLDFDGTDDYTDMNDVAIFDFPDGRNFSIAGWFSRETYTTDDTIVSKKNDQLNSSAGFNLWIDDASDDLQFVVSDGDSANIHTVDSTSTFTDTVWHHFVIVYDDSGASNSKIYIDGRDDSATNTTTGTFTSIASLANAVDFRLGSEADSGEPFAGELDDIMVFNYALTANQVKTLFAQGVANFAPSEGAP